MHGFTGGFRVKYTAETYSSPVSMSAESFSIRSGPNFMSESSQRMRSKPPSMALLASRCLASKTREELLTATSVSSGFLSDSMEAKNQVCTMSMHGTAIIVRIQQPSLRLAQSDQVTVTVQLAVLPLQVAVITELPEVTPVTRPVELTVALEVVAEVQVTLPVPGAV